MAIGSRRLLHGGPEAVGKAGQPRSAPAHLVLLVVADATDQILQILVEHAVDTALDHLEGHRGGPWAAASERNAAAADLGRAGTRGPHLRRPTRCVSGRRGKDDVEARATASLRRRGSEEGPASTDPPQLRAARKWRPRWRWVS